MFSPLLKGLIIEPDNMSLHIHVIHSHLSSIKVEYKHITSISEHPSHLSMERSLCVFLIFFSLFSGLAMGDWNIMNQNRRDKLGISLKNYCESWRINVELNNIKGFEVVPQECTEYIGKYMTSTQYKVDVEVAHDEVTLYLDTFKLKSDGKDAWVFDLDDTLLSTVPYYKEHYFGGEQLNKTCLEEWMKQGKAPAVPHSLELYNEIKSQGIKIFLISSRAESLRKATINNLLKAGYHGWTRLTLRESANDGKTVEAYKAEQRKSLTHAGYHIWGMVGDHWSSLNGSPTAKRTFKLPNSMYYLA